MAGAIKKFQKKNCTVYNGDCLHVLPKIEKNSIDFAITDIPYESTQSHITRRDAKDLNSNFGDWDKFFIEWIPLLYNVLKENSGLVLFLPAHRYETVMTACCGAGFDHVQPWFWHKTNAVPVIRRGLQWAVENMAYFVKGKHSLRIRNKGKCHNLFRCPYPSQDRIHPTQKPVKLLEQIVEYVSDPGQAIIDPFSGSATTGIAALSLERGYVGIEKEKEYFDKSVRRLKKIVNDDVFEIGEKNVQNKRLDHNNRSNIL